MSAASQTQTLLRLAQAAKQLKIIQEAEDRLDTGGLLVVPSG